MRRDPSTTAAAASSGITLFCIPHAGGSAAYYSPLASLFPRTVRVSAVELPGRGRRCREPLAKDMSAMVADLDACIRPAAQGGPYALFGHSLGAMLAYLCTVRAFEQGTRLPETLFLSACPPPSESGMFFPAGRPPLSREEVWQHVVALGGVPEDIQASPDFRAYLEPVLHADFSALRAWRPGALPAIPVPIVVLLGNGDKVTAGAGDGWASLTTGGFARHVFDGGHFYMHDHGSALAALILQSLEVAR